MRKVAMLAALVAALVAAPALGQVVTIPAHYTNSTLSTGTGTCGTPSAGAVHIYVLGDASASIDLGAGQTGTTTFNASTDGANFFTVQAYPQGGGLPVSSTTASGRWQLPVATYRILCVNNTAFTSGSAAIALSSSPAVFSPTQDVGSAANLSATTSNNAMLVTYSGEWFVVSQPVAATAAVSQKAAGAGTVRHVARSVTACISAVAAQPDIIFNLRDGATGAGTIVWTCRLQAVIGTSACCPTPVLNIVGTAATAMTLESSTAPAASNFATTALTGYDAN